MTETPSSVSVATDDELAEHIIAGFRSAFRELRCVRSERVLRLGLSMAHLHALSVLEGHGEMAMSPFADMLDVSLSNATGLVDRMEERGLIERHRVPDDRRVVMVRITEQGRAALAEADILGDDMVQAVLAALDRPRLERLATALDDIREAVDRVLVAVEGSEWHEHAHRHDHSHRHEPAHGADRRSAQTA